MTEQDERAIYEWAADTDANVSCICDLPRRFVYQTVDYEGNYHASDCPPLDMNFAFDVCIPKLRAEGITAWFDNRDWYLDEVATENVSVDADFYSALLAYIKGVK